jgi:hypothetical protein
MIKKACQLLLFAITITLFQCEDSTESTLYINDIFVTSQTSLDALNLERYETIQGNVHLSHISDLNSLVHIKLITGDLTITENETLTSLQPLQNINRIEGQLTINSNDELTSLDGLSSLEYLGKDLTISFNNSLYDITVLSEIDSIRKHLSIIGNDLLMDHTGLHHIQHIEGDLEIRLGQFTSLKGFESLRRIDGSMLFSSNGKVQDIDGLINLEHVSGHVNFEWNLTLNNIDGLSNFNSLDWGFMIFTNNSSLSNFCSLTNVKSDNNSIHRFESNAFNPTYEDIQKGDCQP